MALMWIRANPDRPLPMSLPELRAGNQVPADVDRFIDELLVKKAQTKEMGASQRIPCLDELVENELAAAAADLGSAKMPVSPELVERVDQLFPPVRSGTRVRPTEIRR